SGAVVRAELIARGYKVRTGADIVELANNGDHRTLTLLEETGTTLGQTLADIVGLINPEAVIIGGSLAAAGEPFLRPIREAIYAGAREFATRDLVVERSGLGAVAGLTGASLLAQDALFAPDRISRLTHSGANSLALATV
ncbi:MULTISPECIES: ROK family protein, partial [unclassified Arthrobacter]|uniref:ROK family protein n=1 Tax=unclassified Arthrobacter TaxID=235627 RepID=UPI001C847B58